MANRSNTTFELAINPTESLFITYYPFALVLGGTLFNLLTFLILCRPIFQDAKKRPIINYMRAIAIFDILMMYGWNFDHFLARAYGFTLQYSNIPLCKICSFWNYFTGQSSAWLRVFVCLDRYLSLSRLYKTWFSYSKNILIIIFAIVIVIGIINIHFFPFACYFNRDGSINPESRLYKIYPLWDYINLALYNIIPFIFMSIFNSGVIYHLIQLRKTSTVHNSRIQHRSISITLVITTCLFLIMTTPATVSFGFFMTTAPRVILQIVDYVLYTYHLLSFPIYMITFTEFRQEVIRILTCNRWRKIPDISFVTKPTATQ